MRRFAVSSFAVLSIAVMLAAAPAQATERAPAGRTQDSTSRTQEDTGTVRTAPASGRIAAPAAARPAATAPGLGQGTQKNLSLNPLGGDKKLKKELDDAAIRNTSAEAHDQGKQAGQGLGAQNKDQISGLTTTDEKTQESLKQTLDKKEKHERHQRHCRDACKDGEYGGSALSKTLDGSLGNGGYSGHGGNIFHSKTEEEKQAEEQAKAEAKAAEEAKAKLSLAEKKKLCYQECMNDGSYIDVEGMFGGKK